MSDDKAELGGGASGSSGTRRQCYESGTLNIYTNTFGMIPFAIRPQRCRLCRGLCAIGVRCSRLCRRTRRYERRDNLIKHC